MNSEPKTKHTFWHHLVMVVHSEIVNLVWLILAIGITIGGWVIFKFSQGDFFRIVVGLPLILAGASIALFKVHEILLVIIRPKRLEAICIFCQKND